MFKDLSQYAFINAKIRSRIGQIFTEDELEAFRKDSRYQDLINILIEKEYIPREKIELDSSILNVENCFFIGLLDIYRKIIRWENEDSIKKFIKILLQRQEVQNLKNLLRIWHRKDETLLDYIYKKKIINDIPCLEIYSAESYEQVLDLMKQTPYYNILLANKSEFENTGSLFSVEAALDRFSFQQIFDNLTLLNKRDADIVKKFYGLEADLTNFSLLFRFKNYYNLDYSTVLGYLIPFGQTEKRDILAEEIFVKEKFSFELFDIFYNIPPYILKDLNQKMVTELNLKDKMMLITDLLNQVISIQMTNTLGHYPFTIGIIIVYFLMKEIEIRNLVSILNLKYYNLI
ncbi:MAG: V-type ATPase subunit [bacterium]|nr:V-type ATPase subunit [bacterium]